MKGGKKAAKVAGPRRGRGSGVRDSVEVVGKRSKSSVATLKLPDVDSGKSLANHVEPAQNATSKPATKSGKKTKKKSAKTEEEKSDSLGKSSGVEKVSGVEKPPGEEAPSARRKRKLTKAEVEKASSVEKGSNVADEKSSCNEPPTMKRRRKLSKTEEIPEDSSSVADERKSASCDAPPPTCDTTPTTSKRKRKLAKPKEEEASKEDTSSGEEGDLSIKLVLEDDSTIADAESITDESEPKRKKRICKGSLPKIEKLTMKTCENCGTTTNKLRAKKCQTCRKFFYSHWASRCRIPPCPVCHYSRKARGCTFLPKTCERCGHLLPGNNSMAPGDQDESSVDSHDEGTPQSQQDDEDREEGCVSETPPDGVESVSNESTSNTRRDSPEVIPLVKSKEETTSTLKVEVDATQQQTSTTQQETSDTQQQASTTIRQETSDTQQQASAEASDTQQQASAEASDTQQQASAEASDTQQQISAEASDTQQQISAEASDTQQQTSAEASDTQQHTSIEASNTQQQASAEASDTQQQASAGASDTRQQTSAEANDTRQQTNAEASNTQQHTSSDTQQKTRISKQQASITKQHSSNKKQKASVTQQHTTVTQQHTTVAQQQPSVRPVECAVTISLEENSDDLPQISAMMSNIDNAAHIIAGSSDTLKKSLGELPSPEEAPAEGEAKDDNDCAIPQELNRMCSQVPPPKGSTKVSPKALKTESLTSDQQRGDSQPLKPTNDDPVKSEGSGFLHGFIPPVSSLFQSVEGGAPLIAMPMSHVFHNNHVTVMPISVNPAFLPSTLAMLAGASPSSTKPGVIVNQTTPSVGDAVSHVGGVACTSLALDTASSAPQPLPSGSVLQPSGKDGASNPTEAQYQSTSKVSTTSVSASNITSIPQLTSILPSSVAPPRQTPGGIISTPLIVPSNPNQPRIRYGYTMQEVLEMVEQAKANIRNINSAVQKQGTTTDDLKQDAPTAGGSKQDAPTTNDLKLGAPTTGSLKQTTPTTASLKQTTPTTGSLKQTTPTTGNLKQTTPTTGSLKQTTPTTGSLKQTTPTTGSLKQTTPTTGSLKQTTPTTSSLKQDAPSSTSGIITSSAALHPPTLIPLTTGAPNIPSLHIPSFLSSVKTLSPLTCLPPLKSIPERTVDNSIIKIPSEFKPPAFASVQGSLPDFISLGSADHNFVEEETDGIAKKAPDDVIPTSDVSTTAGVGMATSCVAGITGTAIASMASGGTVPSSTTESTMSITSITTSSSTRSSLAAKSHTVPVSVPLSKPSPGPLSIPLASTSNSSTSTLGSPSSFHKLELAPTSSSSASSANNIRVSLLKQNSEQDVDTSPPLSPLTATAMSSSAPQAQMPHPTTKFQNFAVSPQLSVIATVETHQSNLKRKKLKSDKSVGESSLPASNLVSNPSLVSNPPLVSNPTLVSNPSLVPNPTLISNPEPGETSDFLPPSNDLPAAASPEEVIDTSKMSSAAIEKLASKVQLRIKDALTMTSTEESEPKITSSGTAVSRPGTSFRKGLPPNTSSKYGLSSPSMAVPTHHRTPGVVTVQVCSNIPTNLTLSSITNSSSSSSSSISSNQGVSLGSAPTPVAVTVAGSGTLDSNGKKSIFPGILQPRGVLAGGGNVMVTPLSPTMLPAGRTVAQIVTSKSTTFREVCKCVC